MKNKNLVSLNKIVNHRYKIIKKIRDESTGQIFQALDLELNSIILIKFIFPNITAIPNQLDLIKKNFLISREISHHNILRVFNFDKTQDIYFITMQYTKGITLSEYFLKNEFISFEEFIKIINQILDALQISQETHFFHIHLNWDSILINQNQIVYLMGVGFNKFLFDHLKNKEKIDVQLTLEDIAHLKNQNLGNFSYILSDLIDKISPKYKSQNNKKINHIKNLANKIKNGAFKNPREIQLDFSRIISPKVFRRISLILILIPLILIPIFLLFKANTPNFFTDPGKSKILIFNFSNLSIKKELDSWKTESTQIIKTALSKIPSANIITEGQINKLFAEKKLIKSSQSLKEYAETNNINLFLKGKIYQAGNLLQIDLIIENPHTNHIIFTKKKRVSNPQNIPNTIKELILDFENSLISPRQQKKNSFFMSAYLKSLKTKGKDFYLKGLIDYLDANSKDSKIFFERAIKKNPLFSLPHQKLSNLSARDFDFNKAMNYHRSASKLLRNPEGLQSQLINAECNLYLKHNYLKSLDQFLSLTKKYPNLRSAYDGLFKSYIKLHFWTPGEESIKDFLIKFPDSFFPYYDLIYIYLINNKIDLAMDILENQERLLKNKELVTFYKALCFLYKGEYSTGLALIQKIPQNHPIKEVYLPFLYYKIKYFRGNKNFKTIPKNTRSHIFKGYNDGISFQVQGLYDESIKVFSFLKSYFKVQDSSLLYLNTMIRLTYLYIKNGQIKRALIETEELYEFSNQNHLSKYLSESLHLQGTIFIRQNQFKKVSSIINKFQKLLASNGQSDELKINYYHIMALVNSHHGQTNEALNYFNLVLKHLTENHFKQYPVDNLFYYHSFAIYLFNLGEFEESLKLFSKILKTSLVNVECYDIYYTAHYWCGRIYQKKGWKGKALEEFQQFIDLWPQTPKHFRLNLIIDAKTRIILLNSSSN